MNSAMLSLLMNECVPFNKNVVNGTAKELLEAAPEFLSSIFSDSLKSLNGRVDLKYLGFRMLTPQEEFNRLLNNNDGRINYDLARSDLTLYEFRYSLNGEEFVNYNYLPFSDNGNLINISSTPYHIVPVLSDTVISPGAREVFVRILKDKNSFKSMARNIVIDGNIQHTELIYSYIVKVNKIVIDDNIGKPLPTVSLYLLGKYGFNTCLSKYCNINPDDVIITTDEISDEIKELYTVYESSKIRPKNLKAEGVYFGHNLKICISKAYPKDSMILNFISGVLYCFDILPGQVDDFNYVYNNKDHKKEIMFWRLLLGKIVYMNTFGAERIYNEINDFYDNLEGYMDTLTKKTLSNINIKVENYFDLLAIIMKNYNTLLINYKEYNSDIKNRYIDIYYYIFHDLIIGFNKVILNIIKRSKKTKILTLKEVKKIFSMEMSTRIIYKLVKSQGVNLAMMAADTSTDIIYLKLTCLLEDQSRANGVQRGTKSQFPESTKNIRGHDLVIGTLLFLNKTAPSPRLRINIYVIYDIYNGKIIIEDVIDTIAKYLDNMLQGKLVNQNVGIIADGEEFVTNGTEGEGTEEEIEEDE